TSSTASRRSTTPASESSSRRARSARRRWVTDAHPRRAHGLAAHALVRGARDRPRRRARRRGDAADAARPAGTNPRQRRRAPRLRGQGRREHFEHPPARGDRAGARADRHRGRRPGRLHERALAGIQRERGLRMSMTTLIVLTLVEAVIVVVVLALALIEIRRRLTTIANGLGTLGEALTGVEEEHLRPLRPAVERINAQFDG